VKYKTFKFLIKEEILRYLIRDEIKLLSEALPLKTAKKLNKIQRSSLVQTQIDKIFSYLKKHPNYIDESKRGERLYFKFEKGEGSKEISSTQKEIEQVIKSKGYEIKDYKQGIAIDPHKREMKLGKVLNKEKPELLQKFNTDKTREAVKDTDLMIVISRAPYDLGGMSTDRGWTSCMNLEGGEYKKYLNQDIKQGTLIAYLTSSDDKNLNRPKGRILIKPFINAKDPKDIVYIPEKRVYGTIPKSFKDFIENLFEGLYPETGHFTIAKNLYVDGNIDMDFEERTITNKLIKGFPLSKEELYIEGDLDLRGTKITSLPEGLKVGGNLDLIGTKITSLPKGLEVGGWLDLVGTPITSLPEGLKVGGNIFLDNTPITSLPEDLKFRGHLFLRDTKITSLPEGLKFRGHLFLRNTPITSLPEGLKVGGWLDLRDTPITSLPKGLEVGGNLDLRDTKITSLPEGLKVGGDIHKDF